MLSRYAMILRSLYIRKARQAMPHPTEIQRRLDALEQRINYIDTNGTRAQGILSTQVANQTSDIAEIRAKVDGIDNKLDSAARVRINQYVGIAVALLPIYVLLFMSLFHVTPA